MYQDAKNTKKGPLCLNVPNGLCKVELVTYFSTKKNFQSQALLNIPPKLNLLKKSLLFGVLELHQDMTLHRKIEFL